MNRRRQPAKTWFYALLLAGVLTRPAAADQPIVFTKPADLPTDHANDFMNNGHRPTDSYSAPSSVFGSKPKADFDVLPGARPPRPLSPAELQAMQKYLDEQKNWTLMTPQEILRIPTAEQILGLPDVKMEGNLSVEERYINRQHLLQQQQAQFAATNGMGRLDSYLSSADNPFQLPQDDAQKKLNGRNASDPRYQPSPLSRFGQTMSDSASALSGNDASQDQSSAGVWQSAFDAPPAQPKPDPAQVAAMERFRQLLESSPEPSAVAGQPAGLPAAPAPVIDHNLQPMPSSYNPAGQSVAQVKDTIGRPTGVMPLPTITGRLPNQPAPKPAPLVQPPPWLRTQPQPGQPFKPQTPF